MGRPSGWLTSQQVLQILPSDRFFVLSFLSYFSLAFAVMPAHTPWRLWWALSRGSSGHLSLFTLQVAWPQSQLPKQISPWYSHCTSHPWQSLLEKVEVSVALHAVCTVVAVYYFCLIVPNYLFAYCSMNISSALQLCFSWFLPKFCSQRICMHIFVALFIALSSGDPLSSSLRDMAAFLILHTATIFISCKRYSFFEILLYTHEGPWHRQG